MIDYPKTLYLYLENKVKGDLNPEGRTFYRVFGKPIERVDREGNTYQPNISFVVSPDRRYKKDDPTKVDNAYNICFGKKMSVSSHTYAATLSLYFSASDRRLAAEPPIVPFVL